MRNMLLKNKDGLTEKEFLEGYKPGNYEKPSNTVDMLLFTMDDKLVDDDVKKSSEKELKILLIKRGNHPYMECFAIPGGFVNIDEALNEAAYRELKEETSVENIYLEQLYTWGDDIKRDPRMRVISISYMALVDKNSIKPKAGDDASDVKWFSVKKEFIFSIKEKDEKKDIYNLILTSDDEENKIVYKVTEKYIKNGIMPNKKSEYEPLSFSKEELAFDHVKIIDAALESLKNKIEYTPIAFLFLPKRFTLTELQKIYEVILNRTLLKKSFTKKILPMVKPNRKGNLINKMVYVMILFFLKQ
ncbi:ADP-ribose pyrophosphatase [Clostridium carboxidivorans P7]|uniref:NUDIX hydrolase n=1 Tax=Clostridium carboxidivorans TaxID=217159 RepID=UPI0001D3930A|nr:NUDIX domain-containing protein [Clostridium carboxidivorans]AKN30729.1 ADP-ribose pyrophosphatase [Clostridium carboxidivorans P7]EFG88569.1 hydrolase, NUDIX family [Clostridium carboxidivorans P7]